jgi:putative acetyltransferase
LGCGAFVHFSAQTAEIVRLYSRPNACGVGQAISTRIEFEVAERSYTSLLLGLTGAHARATQFYERNGFERVRPNGAFLNRPEAKCFMKRANRSTTD